MHRRRREKRLAREALTRALATFEDLATVVWAERTRAELARIPQRHAATGLTPTEETIARLAADGLTNREIAEPPSSAPRPSRSTSPGSTASSVCARAPRSPVGSAPVGTPSERRRNPDSTGAPGP